MIKKYIDAMTKGDYKALSECFAKKCQYFDYCPAENGKPNYHVYGRECVEMFFRHKFTFRLLTMNDPVIENENEANFLVSYSGSFYYAHATIEKLSADGLIELMVVRPA